MNRLKKTFNEYVFNSEKVKQNIINNENMKGYIMKRNIIFARSLILAILIFAGYMGFNRLYNGNRVLEKSNSTMAISYVDISINPEIELGLDENDTVVEVVPINSDADILSSDLNLVGLTIDEATEQIIDSAMESGYLDEYSDENTVVVTTISNDEENREQLQEKVINKMNAHFETRKIYPILVAKGLDDELKAEAANYNISYGKMLLVDRALSLDPTLSKDELVTLTIKDIQAKIKSYVNERHEALKVSIQEAKETWKIQKEQLKQDYINKIKELETSISEEHKEEFENMTNEEKRLALRNYLDSKKEEIRKNINSVKEEIKKSAKAEISGYNYPVLENNVSTIKEQLKERIKERRSK